MQINWINFSIFESLKGGSQKIRSNFDLKILFLLIKSKTTIIPLTVIYKKSLIRIVVGDTIDSLNYKLSLSLIHI